MIRARYFSLVVGILSWASATNGQPCTGIAGEWTFNTASLMDTSGQGNHGTCVGGGFGPGIVGQAFELAGDGQYGDFGNGGSLNPVNAITLSAWCRPTVSLSGNDSIIDKGYVSHASPYYQYHLGIDTDAFQFWLALDGVVHFIHDGSWAPGTWYFVVGTYDGAAMKLYINGKVIAQSPASGTMTNYGRSMRIGAFSNLATTTVGAIDQVRIYGRALSESEIASMYASPCSVFCSPPLSATIQASNLSTCLGNNVVLNAVGQGDPPLTYRWRKNGVPLNDFGHYSGTDTANLTISNADFGDQALFDVAVSNVCDSATSAAVNINLCSGTSGCPSPADVNGDGVVNGLDIQRIVEIVLGG